MNDNKDGILQNSQTAQDAAKYYDNTWKSFAERDRILANSFNEARVDFIRECLENIRSEKQIKILDLGCGDGWITSIISDFGEATGIDFAPEAIESAKAKYGDHANFVLADGKSIDLGLGKDKKFDVVICTEVIEHVHNQEAMVQQIHNFLTEGGWCIVTTPNRNVWDAYEQDDRHKIYHQPIENWLSPREIRKIFRKNGFKIKEHIGWTTEYYPYNYFSRELSESFLRQWFLKVNQRKLWMKLSLSYSILQLLLMKK